jgi:hypothetical protein
LLFVSDRLQYPLDGGILIVTHSLRKLSQSFSVDQNNIFSQNSSYIQLHPSKISTSLSKHPCGSVAGANGRIRGTPAAETNHRNSQAVRNEGARLSGYRNILGRMTVHRQGMDMLFGWQCPEAVAS